MSSIDEHALIHTAPESSPASHKPLNVSARERKYSLATGGVLVLNGLRSGGIGGFLQVALGAGLAWRGYTGHCQLKQALTPTSFENHLQQAYGWQNAEAVSRTITIARPRNEVFEFCRDPANLPLFIRRLKNIRMIDEANARWTASAPLGKTLSWNARIEEERPNELVVWSCGPGELFQHRISAHFCDAPSERGTRVHVVLACEPPAGRFGYALAKLLSTFASHELAGDLRRLKNWLETGALVGDAIEHVQSRGHGNAVDRGTLLSNQT